MYAVIQYVLGGIIRHEIVNERDLGDEIDSFPVWRGSVVGMAEDYRMAGLLAEYHADLAEQARREAYARATARGAISYYRGALAEAEGLAGAGGLAKFRSWWARLACHCTFHETSSYYCVPDGGYHRRDCPIYGAPR